jgi:hypothetical protein
VREKAETDSREEEKSAERVVLKAGDTPWAKGGRKRARTPFFDSPHRLQRRKLVDGSVKMEREI